jgi:fatty acid desaturase
MIARRLRSRPDAPTPKPRRHADGFATPVLYAALAMALLAAALLLAINGRTGAIADVEVLALLVPLAIFALIVFLIAVVAALRSRRDAGA